MGYIRSAALLIFVSASCSFAGAIPYNHPGTVAPVTIFTAASTGNVVAYFDGSSAANNDTVTLYDNGVQLGTGVPNYGDSIGDSFILGSVVVGDILIFDLNNQTTSQIFSSNPAQSADGLNHVYATSFNGAGGIPAGTYLGFEDLANADFDYNDDSLVFTNVAFQPTPEPAAFILLAGGLAGLALRSQVFRRRR